MNFNNRVWEITKKIPKGKVSTYKAIAQKLGTKAYRAVGNALRCNPDLQKVPCHRVVCSDGSLGGYLGKNSSRKKIILLKKEGVIIKKNKVEKSCIV